MVANLESLPIAHKPGVDCFGPHSAVSEDLLLRLAGWFHHKGQYRVVG
jgi:hypothetical protein